MTQTESPGTGPVQEAPKPGENPSDFLDGRKAFFESSKVYPPALSALRVPSLKILIYRTYDDLPTSRVVLKRRKTKPMGAPVDVGDAADGEDE